MSNRGGKRKGAGRKSKDSEKLFSKILDEAITSDQWKSLVTKCFDKALEGSINHMRFLAEYRFGKPTEKIKADVSVHRTFEIVTVDTTLASPSPELSGTHEVIEVGNFVITQHQQ